MGREAACALAAIGALAGPAGVAATVVDGAAEAPSVWGGFRLVGSGACRTAAGGEGDFSLHWGPLSAADCERRCARDAGCVGYEVTFSNESSAFSPDLATACEIHREEVVSTTSLTDVECWSKGGAGGQRRFVLLGTGRCLPADGETSAARAQGAGARRCRAECNAQEGCVAYDVAAGGHQEECRLHTSPVTQVEPCEGHCWCWARKPQSRLWGGPARAAADALQPPPREEGGGEPPAGPLPVFNTLGAPERAAASAELGVQAEFGQGVAG